MQVPLLRNPKSDFDNGMHAASLVTMQVLSENVKNLADFGEFLSSYGGQGIGDRTRGNRQAIDPEQSAGCKDGTQKFLGCDAEH